MNVLFEGLTSLCPGIHVVHCMSPDDYDFTCGPTSIQPWKFPRGTSGGASCSVSLVQRYTRFHVLTDPRAHLPDRLPPREKWTKYYQAKNILLMQVYILEGLNSKEKLYDLLRMNYRDDEEFCVRFAKLLMADSKTEEAVKVAEEGPGLFPGHMTEELSRFLDRAYESTSPQKYKDRLNRVIPSER